MGGLIKDYRIKKRLSQLDVSLRIGWKDTSRLSKIEQGRVGKPSRETIEKIINALELTEQEKGDFLLVGGYLLTDKEIEKVIKEYRERLDNWPYPVYIMDFTWRLLYSNLLNLDLLNLAHFWKAEIERIHPNALLFAFLPKDQFPVEVMKGEDADHLYPFPVAQIVSFKTETIKYSGEAWYTKLISSLYSDEAFRELWAKLDTKDYYKKLLDYEFKKVTGIYNSQKLTFNFHMQTAKIINDPRFQIVFYFPADEQTTENLSRIQNKIT